MFLKSPFHREHGPCTDSRDVPRMSMHHRDGIVHEDEPEDAINSKNVSDLCMGDLIEISSWFVISDTSMTSPTQHIAKAFFLVILQRSPDI